VDTTASNGCAFLHDCGDNDIAGGSGVADEREEARSEDVSICIKIGRILYDRGGYINVIYKY